MPNSTPGPQAEAARHVSEAHGLLQALRNKVEEHPELEQAILRLEEALNLLELGTGGML